MIVVLSRPSGATERKAEGHGRSPWHRLKRPQDAEPRHFDHGLRAEVTAEFRDAAEQFDPGQRVLDPGNEWRTIAGLVTPAELSPGAFLRSDHGKLAAVSACP